MYGNINRRGDAYDLNRISASDCERSSTDVNKADS